MCGLGHHLLQYCGLHVLQFNGSHRILYYCHRTYFQGVMLLINYLNDPNSHLYRDRWYYVCVEAITYMNYQIGWVFSMGDG